MTVSRKNLLLTIVVIVVLIATWLGWNFLQKPVIRNLDSSGTTIVAFGDSLVQGVGATASHDFVSLLSERLDQPIINMGVTGNMTEDALARLDTVLDKKPKIVIVLLGGNDYLRRIPMEKTFANLDIIVNKIQEAGAAVLLLGIRGGLLSDAYDDQFEDFATAHQVGFVPNVLKGLIGNNQFMSDTIHPNDAGYAKIADKVEPILRMMLN